MASKMKMVAPKGRKEFSEFDVIKGGQSTLENWMEVPPSINTEPHDA